MHLVPPDTVVFSEEAGDEAFEVVGLRLSVVRIAHGKSCSMQRPFNDC